jgi:hypothetical protein
MHMTKSEPMVCSTQYAGKKADAYGQWLTVLMRLMIMFGQNSPGVCVCVG